jgi:uncharacterized repeat protein (TIGR01451 family)
MTRQLGPIQLGVAVAGVAVLLAGAPIARAQAPVQTTFASGSLIIPMDTTYQDNGMLLAFGLVDKLLRANVAVDWCIISPKPIVNAATGTFVSDFTTTATNFATGATIPNDGGGVIGHAYRGGPFVIDSSVAATAGPIITAWQIANPNTTVHKASEQFIAPVNRVLTAAPHIAVINDTFQAIAFDYMNAAGIPDEAGVAWANTSVDLLTEAAVAGPSATVHNDGALFRASGQPAFCDVMTMHYNVDGATVPGVTQEMLSYLQFPVHLNAECEAVATVEGSPTATGGAGANLTLLTSGGYVWPAMANPPAGPFTYSTGQSPFMQMDGAYNDEAGADPGFELNTGSTYYDPSVVLIHPNADAIGVADLWASGYIFGSCSLANGCSGNVARGLVSFLAGHQYTTTLPISTNATTNGARLFLNSLYTTGCSSSWGQPVVSVAASAPATTSVSTVTFTLSYTNSGAGPALAATLSDVLPAGTTFVSATGGGTNAAGTVTWDLGDLAAGASATVTVTVTLNGFGAYKNSGSMVYSVGLNTQTIDSNTTTTVYSAAEPQLTLTKTAPATTTQPGVTYTLAYDNTGTGAAQAVALSDVLPNGATFISASNGGTLTGNTVNWTVGNVAAGGSGQVTVTVNLGAFGTYGNSGTGTYQDSTGTTYPLSSNTTSTTYGDDEPLLTLLASAPAITAQQTITLTIAYANNGAAASQATKVTDTLPAGATFVSASNGGTLAAGVVTWTLGTVAGGGGGTLTLVVTLGAYGTYQNQAKATYTDGTNPFTATSNTTTTIYGPNQAAIALTASAPSDVTTPQVTYTLNWANTGTGTASAFVITDALPAGATAVVASNGGTFAGGTVTWDVANAATGTNGTLTVTFNLPAAGSYNNQATAAFQDPSGAKHTAQSNVTNTVYAPPPVVTAPANGAILTDTPNPTLTGTAPVGSVVTIMLNGVVVGTSTAVAGTWTLTVSLAIGTYTVNATDTVGGGATAVTSTSSNSNTFQIVACLTNANCSAPTPYCNATSHTCVQCATNGECPTGATCSVAGACVLAAPVVVTPANGSSSSDPITVISGTAVPGSTVDIYVNGVLAGSSTTSATGAWTLNVGPLALGAYTTYATASVGAGGTAVTSPDSNTVGFTITPCTSDADCVSPLPACNTTSGTCVQCVVDGDCASGATCTAGNTCVLAAPVVVTPANGGVVNSQEPPISGTAAPGATVTVSVNGTVIGTATADVNGDWTFTPTSALPLGANVVNATASAGTGSTLVTSPVSNSNDFTIISGCLLNTDCSSPTAPFCNVATNVCVGCSGDNGSGATYACPVADPYCEASGACGLCTQNSDCTGHPGGPICNTATGACTQTCTLDSECQTGFWCASGTCIAKTPNGDPVPNNTPIDGICNAANGTRVCVSGVCDPSNDECGLTNGQICGPPPASALCQSGICYTTDDDCGLPNSQPCTDLAVCRSGVCYTDGECGEPNGQPCGSAAVCRSDICVAANGLCGLLNGSPCTSAKQCQSNLCNSGGTCGTPVGSGCGSATDCVTGICSGGTCSPTCTANSDCPTGDYCASGACVPDLPVGQPCTSGGQCVGGTCGSGGTCGTPTGSPCSSASACVSGICENGQCSATCSVDAGGCAAQDYCSGGSCVPLAPNGGTCTDGGSCLSGACASGQCGLPSGEPCGSAPACQSGACSGTESCTTACTGDSQCLDVDYCEVDGGSCVPVLPGGQPCARGPECLSGVCATSVCGLPTGSPCGTDVICASGHCVDGVCGGADAGVGDGGSKTDAGVTDGGKEDAGEDAGSKEDGGPTDAGSKADGGDAGSVHDSGVVTGDSGPSETDSGVEPDASAVNGFEGGGVSCGTAGGGAAVVELFLLMLAMLAVRSRRASPAVQPADRDRPPR